MGRILAAWTLLLAFAPAYSYRALGQDPSPRSFAPQYFESPVIPGPPTTTSPSPSPYTLSPSDRDPSVPSQEPPPPRMFRAREAFLDEPTDEELLAATDDEDLPFFMRHAREPVTSFYEPEPFHNYRTDETSLLYMPGDGEQFGWLSYESTPYLGRGYRSGITTALNIHLLSGPQSVALPPRLYDFVLGYQKRARLNDRLSVDLASSIGVYSDFEDSARDGVRFPSHGVGILHYNDRLDLVLGVDYVSRDDYKILPVVGYSWHNPENSAWRIDMVFPRPRLQYTLSDCSRVYLAGLLGGGTWDVEFPDDSNDVLTYRDFRILFGFEQRNDEGNIAGVEMGLVFNREIEFRQRPDQVDLDNAFVLRFTRRH